MFSASKMQKNEPLSLQIERLISQVSNASRKEDEDAKSLPLLLILISLL